MSATRSNVILGGEPEPLLLEEDRVRFVEEPDSKVKLQRHNWYEHFEPTGRTVVVSDREHHVYAWSGRTYVAE
ncbi:DUF5988 family protein [Streptomyces sp. NPDC059917]|uniref:DUF5988 family protein n=1 Tax=Streptomyces sp. NPDC059917 TaxID=3347002 RepID=UPI00365CACA3